MIIDYLLLLLGFAASFLCLHKLQGLCVSVELGIKKYYFFRCLYGRVLQDLLFIVLIAWVVKLYCYRVSFPIDETNPIGLKVNGWSDFTCGSIELEGRSRSKRSRSKKIQNQILPKILSLFAQETYLIKKKMKKKK